MCRSLTWPASWAKTASVWTGDICSYLSPSHPPKGAAVNNPEWKGVRATEFERVEALFFGKGQLTHVSLRLAAKRNTSNSPSSGQPFQKVASNVGNR